MNKYVLFAIFAVIFFVGVGVIFYNNAVRFNDLMRGLGNLSPRVLSLLALPFIAVVFVLGIYLRRKSEDRMWKNAVKKTRSR